MFRTLFGRSRRTGRADRFARFGRFGSGELLLFGSFLAVAAVAVVLVAPSGGLPAASGDAPQGWIQTQYGPLSPADRDFLVKVRQAGLWEIPTGQQAQQRADGKRVKEVGMHLVTDHLKLDAQVRSVAGQLGVVLPSQASADQQRWMAELSSAFGTDYDRIFANRLRQAHGKVFTAVAAVRSGTRNDLIRSFAQRAVEVVMKHMTLLESTGLVDYTALPEPPAPQ